MYIYRGKKDFGYWLVRISTIPAVLVVLSTPLVVVCGLYYLVQGIAGGPWPYITFWLACLKCALTVVRKVMEYNQNSSGVMRHGADDADIGGGILIAVLCAGIFVAALIQNS